MNELPKVDDNFHHGLILSLPMVLMYIWAFADGGPSDANNGTWLIMMAVLFLLTLPGSILLVLVGAVAAFAGAGGEAIAVICLGLSVINAHIMGAKYVRLFTKKNPNHSVKRDA